MADAFVALEHATLASNCRLQKQGGINGCTRFHNEVLHQVWNPTTENSDVVVVGAVRSSSMQDVATSESSNTSHVVHNSLVLLHVVPVTLHGPKRHLDTYGMLDTGSICSHDVGLCDSTSGCKGDS